MKKLTLITASLVAMIAFTGCSTLTTWYDSPAGQAEIASIESAAIPIVTSLIQSLIPLAATQQAAVVTPPLTIDLPSVVTAQASAVAQLEAKFPDADKHFIEATVDEEFSRQLAAQAAKR